MIKVLTQNGDEHDHDDNRIVVLNFECADTNYLGLGDDSILGLQQPSPFLYPLLPLLSFPLSSFSLFSPFLFSLFLSSSLLSSLSPLPLLLSFLLFSPPSLFLPTAARFCRQI